MKVQKFQLPSRFLGKSMSVAQGLSGCSSSIHSQQYVAQHFTVDRGIVRAMNTLSQPSPGQGLSKGWWRTWSTKEACWYLAIADCSGYGAFGTAAAAWSSRDTAAFSSLIACCVVWRSTVSIWSLEAYTWQRPYIHSIPATHRSWGSMNAKTEVSLVIFCVKCS